MGQVVGIAAMSSVGSAEKFADEKFRLAVEACPSGMLMMDGAGLIVLVNTETERLFGYRRDELIGQSIEILVPERLRDGHLRHRAQFAAHPRVRRVEASRNLFGLRQDGTEFPVEIGLNPIYTDDGLFVLNVVTDISQRKRMDRLKDEFVSTVSHELRTPLTSISGSIGLLLGGASGKLPDAALRLLGIAQNNCRRLVRLVNDILDIEKAESGKMEVRFKRLDLRALVEQVLETNRAYADGFGITLRLDPAAARGEVYADPDRVAQVITNLLSNAIKFSPAHGEVLVSITEQEQAFRLAVRDHGPGIPKEFRSRLFEKFAQADSTDARQKGGTGLGLSIVKEIAARLGGTVGFEDADGGGTVFHVTLPSWTTIAAREIDVDRSPNDARILLCEDNPDIALTLREGLRVAAFSTDFAHIAAEAAERARAGHYAALVLDLDLPEGASAGLVSRLRAQPQTHRTPVVGITAERAPDRDNRAWQDLGVRECIDKPVDIDELILILNRIAASETDGRARILHVDDDRQVLDLVARTFGTDAIVVSVGSIEEARRALMTDRFDLAIIDVCLGTASGLDLLPSLRGRDGAPIPVIVFSAHPADLAANPQVEANLDKARTSLKQLMDAVHDRLALRRPRAVKEET